jgi:hypothetical protein
MRRAVVYVALLAAAACPRPADVTPLIHVDPRAAGRLDWIARSAPTTPVPKPARVHPMKDGEQLGGPNAVGRPGDLLVENDEIAVVIDQLGASVGFAESGGNIVDAADAHVRKDELGQVFTYFGKFPRQGVYDSLASGQTSDGSAWVEARGTELYEPKLVVVTRYTLHAPDRGLLLETTIANTGDVAAELPSLGDAVQWGGAEKVAPGKPRGFKGPSSGPYVGGVGRFTSYAIASTEGDIDATSGNWWTDTAHPTPHRQPVNLAPGQKVRYARVFIVGERGDSSSLVGELALAAAAPVGSVEVHVPDGIDLPMGLTFSLLPEGGMESLTLAPPYAGHVPVGRYRLADPSGKDAPMAPFEVVKDAVVRVDAPIDPAATLTLRCVGADAAPMPCKFTLEGIAPSPTPSFGPSHAAGPARNQATTATGSVEVRVFAGRYRVTASRGPEYALASQDVELAPREHAVRTLALARVVDTTGYVAGDLHQHTMVGADAPVGTRDRIVANVAEGVEVAVASEHNVVANLEPLVKELGLDRELVSLSGDELTSDACRLPWGHANAFPLVRDDSKPRGGAPVVRDRTASDVFAELRGRGADVVLQINHPRSGSTGYFDLLGFDPARGVGTAPGYDDAFDALEVWNGRNVDARARVLGDFFALLRTSHPVTSTANTDTHGIVGQEAGYPRTYVRVADDSHFEAWDAARTADFVAGIRSRRDVVLTNGPMLRVTAGGAPIGGMARGHVVDVKVHVESAPWVVVDEVRLIRASAPDKVETKRVAPSRRPGPGARANLNAALVAETSFTVRSAKDDAFVVVASGTHPMAPVLAGDDQEITPWAMTGAIWIDADGDGRSLGRSQMRP